MMDAVTQYAEDVLAGRIVAGHYVKLAVSDISKTWIGKVQKNFPYIFEEELAERVYYFFGFCEHTKGEPGGTALELDDFQKFIIGSVFS